MDRNQSPNPFTKALLALLLAVLGLWSTAETHALDSLEDLSEEEQWTNRDCLLEPQMVVDLSSPVAGVIAEVRVDPLKSKHRGQRGRSRRGRTPCRHKKVLRLMRNDTIFTESNHLAGTLTDLSSFERTELRRDQQVLAAEDGVVGGALGELRHKGAEIVPC